MSTENKNNYIVNEHEILKYWEENRCFSKLIDKNKNGKPFRFLDGPMTANNAMGIHHAWGRSIKDIILRYKAMNGYSCNYRNGFDTQGLWVEVEVEKELGFKDKRDIEAFGMADFTNKCVERIKKYSSVITEQSKRLGQWMNWENSYYTHTDENITSIWHFLKKCNENGWISKSYRPMPWCPRCGTSLSEHEMTGSHNDITHTAVFVKLPVFQHDFDILVWTTTPWTLAANTALAVNLELDYAEVKLESCNRKLVLAKSAISQLDVKKEIIRIFKGEELVGLTYETFFPDLSVQKDLLHKIVPWNKVEANEGSGVVHIAPGCGAEDFELGKVCGLMEICPIEEDGCFTDEYGFLKGIAAKEASSLVFKALAEQGKLYKTHEYTHSYPVCWRCKAEVLFRLVESWIIKTDEIRSKLLGAADTVIWSPPFAGKRMHDWLTNMGDWNISRKRFYGLPLPFYPCKNCGHLTVIGSKEELCILGGEKADILPELHRPWIDEIKIKCPACGYRVKRIPEVGDVWLDAGITPFSTLGYFKNRQYWETQFPLDLVLEMNEQIRLWFYSLLFMSVTLTGIAPYKQVITHGSVVQEDGSRFHKSGYMIKFDEAAEIIGSDTVRFLFAGANTSADVRFGYNLGDEARRKLLGFWNIYSFYMTYAEIDNPSITDIISEESDELMDVWLYNRVNDFSRKAKNAYDSYDTALVIREFGICIDDVSNWYVRACRKRFWKGILDSDKQSAYHYLYYAIKIMCQVMAPVIPFMTEKIWQTMIRKFGHTEESVHLSEFPFPQSADDAVLSDAVSVRSVIAGVMKLRNECGLKVKQPLAVLYIGEAYKEVCEKYKTILKDEMNVKNIIYPADFSQLSEQTLSLNFKTAGRILKGDLNNVKMLVDGLSNAEAANIILLLNTEKTVYIGGRELDKELFTVGTEDKANIIHSRDGVALALNIEITSELKAEGLYRELLRHCQVLRKAAGFDVADRVKLRFDTESVLLRDIIKLYSSNIENETLSQICEDAPWVLDKTVEIDSMAVNIKIS